MHRRDLQRATHSLLLRMVLFRLTVVFRCLFLVVSAMMGFQTLMADEMDRLILGNAASEKEHELQAEQSEIVEGACKQPARILLPLETPSWEGGQVRFAMRCDPNLQNYATIKLWGSDVNKNCLTLLHEGKVIGYRHLGDTEIIDLGTDEEPVPGRFYFRTEPLPLAVTRGKEKITLELRTSGQMWGYGQNFEQYQKSMIVPSRGIYELSISTDPYHRTVKGEVLGRAPKKIQPKAVEQLHEETLVLLEKLKQRVNRDCKSLQQRNDNLSQMHVHFLARCWHVKWTNAYRQERVKTQIVRNADLWWQRWKDDPECIHSDKATPNPFWFGLAPLADAVWMLQSEFTTELEEEALSHVSQSQKTARCVGWVDAFVASRDWLCQNRRAYTNQTMIIDLNIQRLDRAIRFLDPKRALPDGVALRYVHEAVGAKPWLGKETPNGLEKPLGDDYWQLTEKGLTKELGYVGGYGEVTDWVSQLYKATKATPDATEGDPIVKKQLAKIMKARSIFRYPTVTEKGEHLMRLETVIGWRDTHFPGPVTYGQRVSWDAGMFDAVHQLRDAMSLGFSQQAIVDGQFYASLEEQINEGGFRVTCGLIDIPDEYEWVTKQASSKERLPMSMGAPDFVWTDEDNGVVALKQGWEILYVSLYWRARYGINRLARFHQILPDTERLATVATEVVFEPSGLSWIRPHDWSNKYGSMGGIHYPTKRLSTHGGEILPIAKIPQGISFVAGQENIHAGKAQFYSARYGSWWIVMNTSRDQTFPLSVPKDAPKQGLELVSGKSMDLTKLPALPPRSTMVFQLSERVAK